MDVGADQLVDTTKMRIRTIVHVYTRRRSLRRWGSDYGATVRVFFDNGSEFSGLLSDLWACHHGWKIDFSRPGTPTDKRLSRLYTVRCGTSA
jgi:putative transposase